MRPNRRMPGTQRPAKQETPVSDHEESPAFGCGMEGQAVVLTMPASPEFVNSALTVDASPTPPEIDV